MGGNVKYKYLCECNSFDCDLVVKISDEEYGNLDNDQCIISNQCEHGPEPTDALVETHEAYSIYQVGD